MNKVKIAIVSYPFQYNLSEFLTIFNLNFHWFQLKLPVSNARIQQTSACNTAPRDALKYCWLYGLKNKAKHHKAAYFVRIQSKQEQTPEELQDPCGSLGRRLGQRSCTIGCCSPCPSQSCWDSAEGHKLHLNLPYTRVSYHQHSLTISNQITASKDVFRPAASTFILMPCGKRWSSHPFIPDLSSFWANLGDHSNSCGCTTKTRGKWHIFPFLCILSQRLSFYVRVIVRREKAKKIPS